MHSIEKLLEIMSALRDRHGGCPWDIEQTFESIAPYTIEEAYEVADAIARNDPGELRSELGDLLFQVVFHSRIAEEQGDFDFADVADAICEKLIRRHPHVFGDAEQRAHGQPPGSWERIKAAERADRGRLAPASALEGVAMALPALKRASKLGQRAANVGFDWPDIRGVRAKVDEELAEVDAAVSAESARRIEEELGDLLFSVANLARHLKIDPEQALDAANRKFIRRFHGVEAELRTQGKTVEDVDLDALEELWQDQKKDSSR